MSGIGSCRPGGGVFLSHLSNVSSLVLIPVLSVNAGSMNLMGTISEMLQLKRGGFALVNERLVELRQNGHALGRGMAARQKETGKLGIVN